MNTLVDLRNCRSIPRSSGTFSNDASGDPRVNFNTPLGRGRTKESAKGRAAQPKTPLELNCLETLQMSPEESQLTRCQEEQVGGSKMPEGLNPERSTSEQLQPY